MVIDREVGGSTMVRVSMDVKDMLDTEKIIPREPLSDCIGRLILELRDFRDERAGLKKETPCKEVKIPTPLAGNIPVTELKADSLLDVYTQT